MIKKLLDEQYNVVLLTASEINNVIEQLKHFGLYNYFNDVLGTSNIYAKSKVEIGVNYINKEAGARELSRKIEEICRKIVYDYE